MVTSIIILLGCAYTLTTCVLVRRFTERNLDRLDQGVIDQQQVYEDLLKKYALIKKEKERLSEKAEEVFTLYELMRSITSRFDEAKALSEFQSKLKERVGISNCRLLSTPHPQEKEFGPDSDVSIFPLRGRRKLLGYLALEGIKDKDRDEVTVLIHQFALALRRIRLYQEIERLAITDSLTEFHTRRYFMERFEEELARSQTRKTTLSVLMVDVDFFKTINDEHGHLTGDQVLRNLALLIRENIREIDVPGRYGGEEFCILLPDTDRRGAQYVAGRIRKNVEEKSWRIYDTQLKLTVSIGVAAFPEDGKSIEELLDKADWALYRAKKNGRNQVCVFGIYPDSSEG